MRPEVVEAVLRDWERPGPPGAEELGGAPLDPATYTDPALHAREVEKVFARAWHPFARESELDAPGRFAAGEVAGRAVAVVRRAAGGEPFAAFRDVCLHRGARILREPCGTVQRLTCPYHGFAYDLDGVLAALPEPASFGARLAVGESRLAPVAHARFGGWVWVRVSAAGPTLAEFLGEPLRDELAEWDLAQAVLVERDVREGAFSWKVGVEAFLEAWHLPAIHRRSAAPLVDHRVGSIRALGDHSRMLNAFRSARAFEPDGPLGAAAAAHGVEGFPRLNAVQRRSNGSYLVFPATIFSFLPNHFTVFRIEPLAVDRVRFVGELYASPSADPRAEAWRRSLVPGYRQLVDEDLENLPWIQRGLAGGAPPLELSWYDRRIRHFRSRVEAWLAAPPERASGA